jgi:hypothetical protein
VADRAYLYLLADLELYSIPRALVVLAHSVIHSRSETGWRVENGPGD